MIRTKGRLLTQVYLDALMCEEEEVLVYFTAVEEITAQIRRQGTVRRALNRAVRKAERLTSKEHECQ